MTATVNRAVAVESIGTEEALTQPGHRKVSQPDGTALNPGHRKKSMKGTERVKVAEPQGGSEAQQARQAEDSPESLLGGEMRQGLAGEPRKTPMGLMARTASPSTKRSQALSKLAAG